MTTTTTPRSREPARLYVIPAYRRAFHNKARYLVLFGGAGSGKSWFVAQKIIARCAGHKAERFLVVRKVARTLRASTFLLFKDILRATGMMRYVSINETEMYIRFPNGSEILHAGLDDVEKLKSLAQPTSIWIEEATEISEEDFVQLDLRLRGETPSYKQIILSFNPVSALHWLKRRFVDDPLPGSFVVHTTYKDNRHAGAEYAQVFEQIRDERLRAIYERGEWGIITKGLIYTAWDTADKMPEGETVYGVDFGYNVPSAVVRLTRREDDLYAEELIYETHLTTADLIARMDALGLPKDGPYYCDAAEPDRIEELYRAGYNAHPAQKDVEAGINTVKAHKLHIMYGGVNLQNELGMYKWAEDRDGNVLDKPVKWNDHACDALRYGAHSHWGGHIPYYWLVAE